MAVASAAHGVLPHRDDDGHSNLGLDREHGALISRPLPGGITLRLHMESLALSLFRDGDEQASTVLDGMTMEDALQWVGKAMGIDERITLLRFPDFPGTPPMVGDPFISEGAANRQALGDAFGNAALLIESLAAAELHLSEARVWPHHFDLGALISLSEDGERSIGLGLSPGDEHFAEPYFYCSPYPAPGAEAELPDLPAGRWHRDGFTSAVLPMSDVLAASDQEQTARSYLAAALAACRAVT